MAKEVKTVLKLQITGGQANPAPPVGPALGQAGIPIQDFCTRFNDATKDKMGVQIPVLITVYEDNSFDFVCKQPPASFLIMQELKLKKGSGEPNKNKIGTITQAQLEKIAEEKMPDLNTNDVKQAAKIIAGTAKQMGLEIKG